MFVCIMGTICRVVARRLLFGGHLRTHKGGTTNITRRVGN